jgi:hypothetical protein
LFLAGLNSKRYAAGDLRKIHDIDRFSALNRGIPTYGFGQNCAPKRFTAVRVRPAHTADIVQKRPVYTLTHHRHLPYFTGNQWSLGWQ